MKHLVMIFIGVMVFAGTSLAEEKPVLENDTERISYSVGYQVGGDFRRQEVDLDARAMVRGAEDALVGNEPLMTEEEMRATLVDLKRKIAAAEQAKKIRKMESYRGEDRAFLEKHAQKEGVVTLPSGLQYLVLREGSGPRPTEKDWVTVAYRGTTVDGAEFDNSEHFDKPYTIPVAEAIPGWQQALLLMKEGAKWQVVLPADLAFGEKGPLADRAVIYDIELVAVEPGG